MKRWVNISDAVEITNNRVKPFKDERRYLATGDLIGDEVNESVVSVDYESKPSRADLLVSEGDIIVARMQATNKVLLIDKSTEDLIVSTGFLTLQPQKDFDGSYLAHYFQSDVFQKQKDKYSSGATQKAINNGAFAKLQVPSYSLDEQKRIANILDQADALRQKRKQSLQLLDDFLRATFLDMFNSDFNDIGCWKPIKSVTKFIDYRGKTPERVSRGVPLISAKCVRQGYFDETRLDFVSEEVFQKIMTRGFPLPNEVLFTTEGATMGYVTRIPQHFKKFAVGQRIITLRCAKDVLPEYLDYTLNDGRIQQEIFSLATGSAAKGIRARAFEKIYIPIPLKESQKKFSLIVQKAEETKQYLQASLSELENQFNALTQRYFG